ncbi:MAG: hypothetical protein HC892_03590 [Saprospiraceae bacterium]|nr:hypothetical protein [Saprospiraceae bacterium]
MSQTEHVEAHQEATNLLDQLKLVFHNDLGAEHLEWMSQFSDSKEDASLILLPVFADEWAFSWSVLPLRLPFKNILPDSQQNIIFTSHYSNLTRFVRRLHILRPQLNWHFLLEGLRLIIDFSSTV